MNEGSGSVESYAVRPYRMPGAAHLPALAVRAHAGRCDPARTVLVVHGMQYGFLRGFDRSASPAVELVHNFGKLRDTCRELGVPVVDRPVQAFRLAGRDQVVIAGLQAHRGCLRTAVVARMRELQPFFVADAMADVSREHHDGAIRQAAEHAVLTTAGTVIGELLGVLR